MMVVFPKDDVKILNTNTLGDISYFKEYANISSFNMYANNNDRRYFIRMVNLHIDNSCLDKINIKDYKTSLNKEVEL